ncbi:hypothetical protein LIER_07233 [Lithospermum erythrorhizon]|uniref:Transmembrane protein n=1 Tax=Lithospermum erythrorhizon TaxID=34254 RepID=A0AAV3P8P5_LITER
MITSSLTSKAQLICWVVSVFIIVSLVHAESPTLNVKVHDGQNDSLILASDETRRQDPFNSLEWYTGGWNISNKHYIGSLAYTAAPLFLTAGVWFVGVGLFMLLSCLCFCCCCRQRSYGYSKSAYACSVGLLILFTIVAVFGAVVLYTGEGKYHESTADTLDYVVDQADSIVKNLKNVSSYLTASKKVGVNQTFLPPQVQKSIDNVASMINSSATTLETVTVDNKDDIKKVLETVRHILVVVAAAMLLLALLGFLFSVFGLQFLVYILIIVTWILVAGTFILSGVFLLLHNATGDTCIAMDEWVENPRVHTALDDILPCIEPATAEQSLSETKDVVFQLVQGVNGIVTNVSNANFSVIASPLAYNQSGPPVPILCNPFNKDMSKRKCVTGEVDLSNATEVWKNNVCQVSTGDVCITVGRLTPSMFDEMAGVVNVSYGLYHYGPFLTDLVDCTFVRETFSGIYNEHCPDLKKYSEWVYIGLTMVSGAVALSMIFWLLYARERRHRKYTKLVDSASHRGDAYGKGP